MAVVERVMPATPAQIFAVLADGWSYSDWVVGTAHIRDVDADWPQPGSQLYHQAAIGLKDKTVVLASDPPHSMVMRPNLWPMGELTVKIILTPINDRETRVTLHEDFAAGPLRWFRNKVNDLAMHWRNKESLRRLSDLASRKTLP
jgi:hypothetical protein